MITDDMAEWLAANMGAYERFLLHGLLHNEEIRRNALPALSHKDFGSDAVGLCVGAMKVACALHEGMSEEFPISPSLSQFRPHIRAAAVQHDYGEQEQKDAMALLIEMEDVSLSSTHIYVEPYFAAWFTTVRSKIAARAVQRTTVVDAAAVVERLTQDIALGSGAFDKHQVDDMDTALYGTSKVGIERRSTGIAGLDRAMAGGYAKGEAYLIFAPTGGGKSVLAGQLALYAVLTSQPVMVVTTELKAYEYIGRIASAALTIPISLLVNCDNVALMRDAISASNTECRKLEEFDSLIEKIKSYLFIRRVDTDELKSAAAAMERCRQEYLKRFGKEPVLAILDWFGNLADKGNAGAGRPVSSSERSAVWEQSASGLCKWADNSGIATFYLAQAENGADRLPVLGLGNIGIGKGIAKDAVLAIGVTATLDLNALKEAATGKAEAPQHNHKPEQFFCCCKARKGETFNVPMKREFKYQRFGERPY